MFAIFLVNVEVMYVIFILVGWLAKSAATDLCFDL